MQKTLLAFLFLFVITICKAQTTVEIERKISNYYQHKAFYLSICGGANSASISLNEANLPDYHFKGIGAAFDFKIGYALVENLILHATLASKSMLGPEVSSNGYTETASGDISIGETMIGGGLTYYIMPVNIFCSGSIGLGNVSIENSEKDMRVASEKGFAMQVKIGKEWWISRRWGLGFALAYERTKLTNNPPGDVKELIDSNNFGIHLSATFD